MGGAFSCGQDNEELVNILIVLGYIKSKSVERVFREVDRGDYVSPFHRALAYKDLSWKHGNLHLSAPCIYCKVMEGLSLEPGLSFLNIGSGTGYLSTMAGLILGENGTNHGIEMHEDCLTYAYEHLAAFKEQYLDVDSYEFCEPTFQFGNFLNVIPNRQYDRVYCGAACPEVHEKFVKQFVKIGGILVMPYKDHLRRIERIDEATWHTDTMLPVTFAMLATPQEENDRVLLHLPMSQPTTLQELCRGSIRRHLRRMVWSENNDLEYKTVIGPYPVVDRPSPELPFGIPLFEESNRAHPSEVITATRRLVRVVRPSQRVHRDSEDEKSHADSSEDSDEDVDRCEIDLFVLRALNEPADSTKEIETTETEMQQEDCYDESPQTPMEEDDIVESTEIGEPGNSSISEVTRNAEIQDYDSDQADSLVNRSMQSNLKRLKSDEPASSRESDDTVDNKLSRFFDDNDVPEAARNRRMPDSCSSLTASSNIDADANADADADLSFSLIKKAFSILKGKYDTVLEGTSESSVSSDSSSDETSPRDNDRRDASAIAKHTLERNVETRCSVESRNAVAAIDGRSGSPPDRGLESPMNDKDSNISIDSSNGKKNNNLHNDKHRCDTEDVDKSLVNNRDDGTGRSLRNRRCLDESKMNEMSDSSSDMSSEDRSISKNLHQRYKRSGQKKRSEQRFNGSGSKESLPSKSSIATSSNSLSDDNDSDIDLHFIRGKQLKRFFAHKIRKDAVTNLMKTKINQLPLPLPLRRYINYNREL